MDNTEPSSEHGLFWLRDNEDRKLWGTLYVNEVNESRLETFGSLIDPAEETLHTIVGQIRSGQECVTLIDCFPTNTRNLWPIEAWQTDWSRQTCLVNKVVEGISLDKGEEIAFERATLSISSLPKWANPNIVKLDYEQGTIRPIRVNISIEDRADETTKVSFRGEEVKISLRFLAKRESGRRGVITTILVEDHCLLIIERSDGNKMSLDSTVSIAKAMLDLLSICCNETPAVTSFSAHQDKSNPRPAKLYVRMRGYDAEMKEGYAYPALSLEDLGGIEGVARWIEVAEKYEVAVAVLTSNWYNDRAYYEDALSRMYTAVESLVSRKKKRNRAKMKSSELAQFVEEAIPNFSSITNRLSEEWAKEVKELRDQKISHLDPINTSVTDGRGMHVLTNLLYIAGASFLLREIGMGDSQIEKYIDGCRQTLLLREH